MPAGLVDAFSSGIAHSSCRSPPHFCKRTVARSFASSFLCPCARQGGFHEPIPALPFCTPVVERAAPLPSPHGHVQRGVHLRYISPSPPKNPIPAEPGCPSAASRTLARVRSSCNLLSSTTNISRACFLLILLAMLPVLPPC